MIALAVVMFASSQAQDVRSRGKPHKATAGALGRLEPESGLIAVGVRPGTRIDEIKVTPGQVVETGTLLAILEGHAQVKYRQALRKLEREQFDKTQKAKLEAAETVAKSVKERYDTATPLYKALAGTLKGKERFDAEAAYLQIETQNTQSALNVTLLKIAQEMTDQQRKLEDKTLEKIESEQTELYAPSAGRVLEIKTHAGEISSGVVLSLGDTSKMVAMAEVFETDVPRVAIGDPAEVRIFDKTVTGKVTAIGLTVSRNQLTSLDPRALQDRRVVEVTVKLDDPEPASRYVNMQVDVMINPGAK